VTPPASPRSPATPSDADLLARAAGGDEAAFATLYHRHAASVMAFAWHLAWDRSAAEDAVQETFWRVWRAAARFRPGAPLEPWLYRIARRAALDARRRARGRPREGSPAPEPAAPARGPDDLDPAASAGLRDAVDRLSGRLRVAFVLVRLGGHSYADAATILQVPEGTVKSRVAAAQAAVRRRLARGA
jgi:RNA polymerase sigma-70 factor (ECF subfamily)